jgi:hypothetical protein
MYCVASLQYVAVCTCLYCSLPFLIPFSTSLYLLSGLVPLGTSLYSLVPTYWYRHVRTVRGITNVSTDWYVPVSSKRPQHTSMAPTPVGKVSTLLHACQHGTDAPWQSHPSNTTRLMAASQWPRQVDLNALIVTILAIISCEERLEQWWITHAIMV